MIIQYIPDYVEEVVAATAAALGRPVYFQKGNYRVVENNLLLLDGAASLKDKKYPFFWLVLDIKETHGSLASYADVLMSGYLITGTDMNYTVDQRRDISFIANLYPIYEELLNQFVESVHFKALSAETIEHEKTDLHYWGINDANMFSDFVDAIALKNLKLSVNRKIC